ncbi:MAG: S-layer homology domain-containing protein [Oscillospiraceae bacterium]|nr:S-layer homology domain-containing protein [Oscillospiraceae bacterium]
MKKLTALVLSFVLAVSLLACSAQASGNVTVTVTMDTQSVAENVSDYGLSPLPATAEVTVPAGSTVETVLAQWASEQNVSTLVESSTYGPYLKTIGAFGAFGTDEFTALCAAAGYTPAGYGDIFEYAGWTYTVDGVGGLGLGNDTVEAGDEIAFRYGLYMASGTWEQVDHLFLDAYNALSEKIAGGDAANENEFTPAQWQTLSTALAEAKSEKAAVDEEAAGMWMNYFAQKQTALWGTGSPTDKLQKAAAALDNALNKVVSPESITFAQNDVELPLNQTLTIAPIVNPEGAPQDVVYEAFLGDTAFAVSEAGVVTPSGKNNLCWVKVSSKNDASVFSYFKFKVVDARAEPAMDSAQVQQLLSNIAASYASNSGEWVVMDMAAYKALEPTASGTSEAAKKAYIDAAIDSLTANGAGESTYAKAILALQSIGVDARELYASGRNGAKRNAVALLTALETHGSSAWVAPFTLAALNQGDYGTDELEQSIVSAVLAGQSLENGSWSEWGDSVQTTANVIAGLSFYYGTDPAVTAVLDKAVEYLSSVQSSDGSFDAYGTGADANTQAMVIIALSALGIDADSDARFVKGEASVLDALLTFAVVDGSGFGYTDNSAVNAGATEQGFRALLAAKGMHESAAAFNIYDFSANTVAPAYHSGYTSGGGGSVTPPAPPQDTGITVSFTLKTHEETWIAKHTVEADEGSSVGDVTVQVLDAAEDISYVNLGGYISSITKGEKTLAAMTLDKNSGWKYSVNGEDPVVGMNDMTLSDGDELVWYYVVDYTAGSGGSRPAQTQTPEEEKPTQEAPAAEFADTKGHWAAEAIAYCAEKGIMNGTGEGAFSPNVTASRAMLAKVLYALAGQPSGEGKNTFTDVESGAWYADAVAWASESGIVTGSEGKFMPDASLTREQLAVMLWRYERGCGHGTERAELSFADTADISPWAAEAVEWAFGAGVLRGSDGRVMPQKEATRAELAQVFFNLFAK